MASPIFGNRKSRIETGRLPSLLLKLIFVALACFANFQIRAQTPGGETNFLGKIRQLTLEGRRSGEGYFSSDGQSLVFQSERDADNPFYQIYLLDLETGDCHRVSPGVGKTTCAFLQPGGDRVLFASSHLDVDARAKQKAELEFRASGKQRRYAWDYDDTIDIFSTKRDGSDLRRLTRTPGYDAEGSYSPDGKLIAFSSLRDAYPTNALSAEDHKRLQADPSYFGEIYLMNADGSDPRRLTRSAGYDGGPFFSPDGRRIIWRHFEESGAIADIYTMNLDGSDVQRLTDFKAMSWAPYFHPSGEYAIFAANKLGFSNFELYLVDIRGTREPVRVTHQDGFDGLPVFSPDGKRLTWTSTRTPQGASQIFIAEWNHGAAQASLASAPLRTVSASADTTPGSNLHFQSSTSSLTVAAAHPAISQEELRSDITFLASDDLEGRLTGTLGAQKASEFIAEQLRKAGLQPLGVNGTYFQPFEFNSGVNIITNQNEMLISITNGAAQAFDLGRDFRPLSFTANGTAEGSVVFAGYGLSVPPGTGPGYDSYAGLDVSNKIVLVLRYVPEAVDAKRRQELNRYAGLRYKALIARNRGARGMIVVTGPNSPNAGELAGFTYDTSQAGSGIVAVTISGTVADAMLSGSGRTLKSLQDGLDSENPHAEHGVALTNSMVRMNVSVRHTKRSDRNVIGWLPPASGGTNGEVVLIGAHFDHLGRGETGGFARKDEEGQIHNGADDNASGTAALLELAGAFGNQWKNQPGSFSRGLVFAFWSGEELGLIGSAHYAEHPPIALSNTVAYLNFDMVGRLRENKLILNGTGSSTAWRRILEKRNVAAGFNLQLLDDPFPPTDVTTFYPKGIPVLSFFTGNHEEYHRPADKPATLNYEGIEQITDFVSKLVTDLVRAPDRPDYLKVERAGNESGSRENLRAYLGTIPDYATDVTGVKLSGVRGGSPADKAGLKSGDIIIQFAGQKVANIYDYTYALDAVKIGSPVTIVVTRGGEPVQVTAIPEARK